MPSEEVKNSDRYKASLRRANRDGSRTKRVTIQPTEKELAKVKRIKQRKGYDSIAETITEMIVKYPNKQDEIRIDVPLDISAKAEHLAHKLGYKSTEEWMEATLRQFIEEHWGVADIIDPEWWGSE